MYTEFYGMKLKPFSLAPDPNFLYLSEVHKKCATVLQYGMLNNTGFTVVCGEIGSGKSTLIQHLLKTVDPEVVKIGHINNTFRIHDSLLEWVLDAFDVEFIQGSSRVEQYRMFSDFVINEYAEGRRVALIIDEAQNLDKESIEELRLLSNINVTEDIILQMLFVGQPELAELIESPELRQFAQRIGIEFSIPPLEYGETKKYIQHRLDVAGVKKPIFTEDAIAALYCYTGGLPRKINNVADMALVYGYAEQAKEVDAQIISDTISDRIKSGLFKIEKRDTDEMKEVEKWLKETKAVTLVKSE